MKETREKIRKTFIIVKEEKRRGCNKTTGKYDTNYCRRKNTLHAECIQQIKNNNVDEYRRNN